MGSHKPLRQSLFCEQKPQMALGGLQVQEPSLAHMPPKEVQSEPASTAHRVVWQTPASVLQRLLAQSLLAMQLLQSATGGKHWQEPLALQVPLAEVHSAVWVLPEQLVVWQKPLT